MGVEGNVAASVAFKELLEELVVDAEPYSGKKKEKRGSVDRVEGRGSSFESQAQ